MASSTENVKLGVCTILFDGNDLGYTKGGVEVEVATTTHEVKVDQFGETPISELITGRTVTVKTPLAETTIENLVAIMPGAELVTDGVKASGTVTFKTNVPADGDKVSIGENDFVFKTTPVLTTDIAIPDTIENAAVKFAAAVNAANLPYKAKADSNMVTLTAINTGKAGNAKVTKTGSAIFVTDISGGADSTKKIAIVKTGINTNLIDVAKTLVLRPIGTDGEDDFIVYRAACPGALNFAYQTENERVFQANFKGYALENGKLFGIGKE